MLQLIQRVGQGGNGNSLQSKNMIADSGKFSEQFGVYLRNSDSSQWGEEIVRLLFVNRRPIRIIKTQRFGQAEEIVDSINAFVAEHPLP